MPRRKPIECVPRLPAGGTPPSLPRADTANASIGPAGFFWNIVRFNFQLRSPWVTCPSFPARHTTYSKNEEPHSAWAPEMGLREGGEALLVCVHGASSQFTF